MPDIKFVDMSNVLLVYCPKDKIERLHKKGDAIWIPRGANFYVKLEKICHSKMYLLSRSAVFRTSINDDKVIKWSNIAIVDEPIEY